MNYKIQLIGQPSKTLVVVDDAAVVAGSKTDGLSELV